MGALAVSAWGWTQIALLLAFVADFSDGEQVTRHQLADRAGSDPKQRACAHLGSQLLRQHRRQCDQIPMLTAFKEHMSVQLDRDPSRGMMQPSPTVEKRPTSVQSRLTGKRRRLTDSCNSLATENPAAVNEQ